MKNLLLVFTLLMSIAGASAITSPYDLWLRHDVSDPDPYGSEVVFAMGLVVEATNDIESSKKAIDSNLEKMQKYVRGSLDEEVITDDLLKKYKANTSLLQWHKRILQILSRKCAFLKKKTTRYKKIKKHRPIIVLQATTMYIKSCR